MKINIEKATATLRTIRMWSKNKKIAGELLAVITTKGSVSRSEACKMFGIETGPMASILSTLRQAGIIESRGHTIAARWYITDEYIILNNKNGASQPPVQSEATSFVHYVVSQMQKLGIDGVEINLKTGECRLSEVKATTFDIKELQS
jgi:hypothetical protein